MTPSNTIRIIQRFNTLNPRLKELNYDARNVDSASLLTTRGRLQNIRFDAK